MLCSISKTATCSPKPFRQSSMRVPTSIQHQNYNALPDCFAGEARSRYMARPDETTQRGGPNLNGGHRRRSAVGRSQQQNLSQQHNGPNSQPHSPTQHAGGFEQFCPSMRSLCRHLARSQLASWCMLRCHNVVVHTCCWRPM